MSGADHQLIYILVAGVAANAVWRLGGLLLSSGLSEDGPVIAWVNAVSTALVAGLVARIVVFPPGALADVAMPVRIGAFALGIGVYYAARRRMGLAILVSTATLIAARLLGG
jgi:Branched-chain amino acid transport protein (AzlD)